jgi:hypothetical protein
MDTIDTFVVICTVVLFCSWGYLIWTNWKGGDYIIRFPPYGFDACPIGYYIHGSKCKPKTQSKKVVDKYDEETILNPYTGNSFTSDRICSFYDNYGKDGVTVDENGIKRYSSNSLAGKKIMDGFPTANSHRNYDDTKMWDVISSCCESGGDKSKCNKRTVNMLIGSNLNDDDDSE